MSIDTISGRYFILNNEIRDCMAVRYNLDNSAFRLYEVLRTRAGKLLFGEDHIQRMKQGFEKLGTGSKFNANQAREILEKVVEVNGNATGNLKLYAGMSENTMKYASAYIPHKYPSSELYKSGVALCVLHAERDQPLIKQISVSSRIKDRIDILQHHGYYESLLVDKHGYVSEGSRSNFFLISDGQLFSAPEEDILPGITRKHVLSIAEKAKINVVRRKISYGELAAFQSAFICGTSPGVLPVNSIEEIQFSVSDTIVQKLMSGFNDLLNAQ